MATCRTNSRLSPVVAVVILLWLPRAAAQPTTDRATATDLVPPPQFVRIDDQLFDVAGRGLVRTDGRSRPQGTTSITTA